jgi:hypothetical protein
MVLVLLQVEILQAAEELPRRRYLRLSRHASDGSCQFCTGSSPIQAARRGIAGGRLAMTTPKMRVEQTAKRPSPISPTACNRGLLDRLDIEAGDRSLKQAEPRQ